MATPNQVEQLQPQQLLRARLLQSMLLCTLLLGVYAGIYINNN